MTRLAAARHAEEDHETGRSRQRLRSDSSHGQRGRNALARTRQAAPAAEPTGEGQRLGPEKAFAWEGVRKEEREGFGPRLVIAKCR